MWKVTLLIVFLGQAIGQDFLRTYPLRGGLSPTAEERQYLQPEPFVPRYLPGDYRPTVPSASARVYWPFDRMPSPDNPSPQEPFVSAQAYAQPQNPLTLSPLKNTIERYPSENFERELDDPYPVRFPGSVRTDRRRLGLFRRPQTINYDQELQNSPPPVGIPINNFGTPPYTNFIPRPNRIHRPNYFDPRGINYAPTFSNYIPITRFHHDQKPELGEYNVAFETANGIAQNESGFVKRIPVYNYKSGRYEEGSANVKTGYVSWTSPEGIPFSYRYTADEQGFKVEGDHIPSSVSGGQGSTESGTATIASPPPFNRDVDINSYKPVIPYNPISIQRNYK